MTHTSDPLMDEQQAREQLFDALPNILRRLKILSIMSAACATVLFGCFVTMLIVTVKMPVIPTDSKVAVVLEPGELPVNVSVSNTHFAEFAFPTEFPRCRELIEEAGAKWSRRNPRMEILREEWEEADTSTFLRLHYQPQE